MHFWILSFAMEQCSIVLHPVLCIFFSVHNAKRMLLPNRLRRFFFRAKMMTLLLLFFFFFSKSAQLKGKIVIRNCRYFPLHWTCQHR